MSDPETAGGIEVSQWARGNQNVQINDVASGANITIHFSGGLRSLPMEPAHLPVAAHVTSPARLLRARAAFVPWVERAGVLDDLTAWATDEKPYAVQVIGGRGGAGKTRLAVELCRRAKEGDWLCGMLKSSTDIEQMEILAQTPVPRLIVIDYAESRTEQLEFLLPALASSASVENPVRVMLLVRKAPKAGSDWIGGLRTGGDLLDAALDAAGQTVLQDFAFPPAERDELFDKTTTALAKHLNLSADRTVAATGESSSRPKRPDLHQGTFDTPLMVSIASFLWLASSATIPTTRSEILSALVTHEDKYWKATQESSTAALRERVVALAALAGAGDEDEAAALLALIPDLADASSERRHLLARWAHDLYPQGPRWWNPIEPDILGEHLVASCFTGNPAFLAGAIVHDDPSRSIQPLELLARAIPENPEFAPTVSEFLNSAIVRLTELAVTPTLGGADGGAAVPRPSLAVVLDQLVASTLLDLEPLLEAEKQLPRRTQLAHISLALTITIQIVLHLRESVTRDPQRLPDLAKFVQKLASRLAQAGQREPALTASEEAVSVYRELAADGNGSYEHDLADSLNDLAACLANTGRREEAVAVNEEAIALRRKFALAGSPQVRSDLAISLSNHSSYLWLTGRDKEALSSIQDAVRAHRDLVSSHEVEFASGFAGMLENLSHLLSIAGRHAEALAAIEESVSLHRDLTAASASLTVFSANLGLSLKELSQRLSAVGRHDEALEAGREAVSLYRAHNEVTPDAYSSELASALMVQSRNLWIAGTEGRAVEAMEEALAIYRDLAADQPSAYQSTLASTLFELFLRQSGLGRDQEAFLAISETVVIYRELCEIDSAIYEEPLATANLYLASELSKAGRAGEASAIYEKAVASYRELATSDPSKFPIALVTALNAQAEAVFEAGQSEETVAAPEEAAR